MFTGLTLVCWWHKYCVSHWNTFEAFALRKIRQLTYVAHLDLSSLYLLWFIIWIVPMGMEYDADTIFCLWKVQRNLQFYLRKEIKKSVKYTLVLICLSTINCDILWFKYSLHWYVFFFNISMYEYRESYIYIWKMLSLWKIIKYKQRSLKICGWNP